MGKRLHRHDNLKYWWCYDLEEVAAILKVHVQTVRTWIKYEGLKTIDDRQPLLIYGLHLIDFIKKQNHKGKCKTPFDQLYCMSCKDARPAFQNIIAFEQKSNGLCVKAVCRICKSKMNKTYKLSDFQKLKRTFNVVDVSKLYDCEHSTDKTHIHDHIKTNQSESSQGDLIQWLNQTTNQNTTPPTNG